MKQGIDYIGISCVFYCHDGKGNLLLHRRSPGCRDERGKWDCGGGALKFGETFEEGVRREISEEYCTGILSMKKVGINNVIRTDDGVRTHWIAVVFAVEVDRSRARIGVPGKMSQIGWFQPDKLPKPLHSMFLTHLAYVKKAGILP